MEVENLVKAFRNRTVVGGVSLTVKPGEAVGLLGPNGAGKTTTFKMILGLLRPDRGTVHFGGSLDGLPLYQRARRGLGYLPQGPSVFRGLSCRDNLRALLEALKEDSPGRRADELLERFGLSHLASQKAVSLSGGERRRLELARALTGRPSILLCDEPFSSVDPLAATDIAEAMFGLKESGVGLLITDHSVRKALTVCDRVYLLVDGRIVAQGTPSEVLDSETARRAYFGTEFL